MNLCEGRVGKQETAAAAWIACVMAGIFTVDTQSTFKSGNVSYAATLFAAAAALGVFCLVAAAMRAWRLDSLPALYRCAFGSAGGFVFMAFTALTLVYAAVVPLGQVLSILCRYIFVESGTGSIALYFLPVVTILAVMGLETITRTSRLFALVIFLSILAVLLIALPTYKSFRLYPLLGGGAAALSSQSIAATARYLPVMLALLICGRGVQGLRNASRAAATALIAAAAVAAIVQLCMGMTYTHETLAGIHSPMFRLTATVRTGGAYLRTDKLLLFIWLVGALLAAAFLSYAAALAYTRASGMRDVRPAALVFSVMACALSLLMEAAGEIAERVADFLRQWSWIFVAGPPLIAAGVAALRGRERT